MRQGLIDAHISFLNHLRRGRSPGVCAPLAISLHRDYGFHSGRKGFVVDFFPDKSSLSCSGNYSDKHSWVHYNGAIYDVTACQFNEFLRPENQLPLGLSIVRPGTALFNRYRAVPGFGTKDTPFRWRLTDWRLRKVAERKFNKSQRQAPPRTKLA